MNKGLRHIIVSGIILVCVFTTAILMVISLPSFKRASELITVVTEALHLNPEDESTEATSSLHDVAITFKSEKSIKLKKGSDKLKHKVSITGYTLSLESKSTDYAKVNQAITDKQTQVTNKVLKVIRSHTNDDLTPENLASEVLAQLKTYFDTDSIRGISFQGLILE